MSPRAADLIRMLELRPHPEGGFYRETWRSPRHVSAPQWPLRNALTMIYYLLTAGAFSAWHRVRSDEVWHWYEGDALELLLSAPDFSEVQRRRLGPVTAETEPVVTVPADWWQAARPTGEYALCGCTVAPGFEFEDFTFLREEPASLEALQRIAPDLSALL